MNSYVYIIRGGSWYYIIKNFRVFTRGPNKGKHKYRDVGFRLMLRRKV